MTFDSISELNKITSTLPRAKLILCTKFEVLQEDSQPNLAVGCDPDEAVCILERAKELGLQVVGIRYEWSDLK